MNFKDRRQKDNHKNNQSKITDSFLYDEKQASALFERQTKY